MRILITGVPAWQEFFDYNEAANAEQIWNFLDELRALKGGPSGFVVG
jgi:hypothetical protein